MTTPLHKWMSPHRVTHDFAYSRSQRLAGSRLVAITHYPCYPSQLFLISWLLYADQSFPWFSYRHSLLYHKSRRYRALFTSVKQHSFDIWFLLNKSYTRSDILNITDLIFSICYQVRLIIKQILFFLIFLHNFSAKYRLKIAVLTELVYTVRDYINNQHVQKQSNDSLLSFLFSSFLATLCRLEKLRFNLLFGRRKSTALKSFQLIVKAEVASEIDRSQRMHRANITALQ